MSAFLGLLAVLLLFLIFVLVGRMTELSSMLKGTENDYEDDSRIHGSLMLGFLVAFFIGIVICTIELTPKLLPEAASLHGVVTDEIFNVTLFFTGIVFVITHILLFWFAYKYRQQKGNEAVHFAHSTKLELIWTAIPAVVMTVLVVMGLKAWYDIFPSMDEMEDDKVIVEVVGKQFNWIIRYPGMDGDFGNRIIDAEHVSLENELGIDWDDQASHDDFFSQDIVLIKDKPVLVKLGALDVLHAFYLPHFRVKMDCVPGIPTSFYFTPTKTTEEMREMLSEDPTWQAINPETGEPRWKTFEYELACAELCGRAHYGMRKVVKVVSEDEYVEWYKAQTPIYQPAPSAEAPAMEEAAPVEETIEEATELQAAL